MEYWLNDGHCEMLLVFRRFFSPPNLGGLLANRHQTLLRQLTCSMATVVYKTELEIWSPPPLTKLAAQRYHNFCSISDNFATLSRISPDWNKMSSIGKWRCKN